TVFVRLYCARGGEDKGNYPADRGRPFEEGGSRGGCGSDAYPARRARMPPRRGGTIGILDRLYDGNYIDEEEFHHCIGELMEHNGGKVRLPVAELKKRMK
ncbi:MAG: hypothetical protein LUG99_06935, partial [Lachnospiraceae bacterium]|nr:hypothetical protein [Lachnospiraceae bacterium]